MDRIKNSVSDILIFLLGLIIVIGSLTFFSACGPMEEDGMQMWMNCHWAQVAVTISGAVISIFALVSFFLKGKLKATFNFIEAVGGVLVILFPTVLIHTCMMNDMRCNAIMKPCAILFGALVAVIAVISAILNLKKKA
ncbi:MAG: DUF4418 family protein [Ruminococcus sp.]|nr:DUF4418 family protein [Ruminococcus sp.]